MKPNESLVDRALRAVIAIVAAIFAVKTSGALSVVLWVVTAAMAITALIGWCTGFSGSVPQSPAPISANTAVCLHDLCPRRSAVYWIQN